MKSNVGLRIGIIALCAFGMLAQAASLSSATLNAHSEGPTVIFSGPWMTARIDNARHSAAASFNDVLNAMNSGGTYANPASAADPADGIGAQIAAIPEPATLLLISLPLLLFGGAAIGSKRRKEQKRNH